MQDQLWRHGCVWRLQRSTGSTAKLSRYALCRALPRSLGPAHGKPSQPGRLALARQPQIMPRQVLGLGLALGARWVILEVPPRPRARARRAVAEQPRLSVRELVARPTADPEREQL